MALNAPMNVAILSEEQKKEVENVIREIAEEKSRTLLDYIQSLGEELTSKDVALREAGINKLSAVVLQMPSDILTVDIAHFLLEFLLPRVEDSGHVAAESLIPTIHFLVLRVGDANALSGELVAQCIGTLYETNGVQSYVQRDRMTLFNLLQYLMDNSLDTIRSVVGASRLIVAFMRSANSERDPRCLLKIFRVFNQIARNLTLGALAEDIFELVACYFPIDYEPNETDTRKITREMLSMGCESCLLSNAAFAPFCFQLISEKLLEDPSTSTVGGVERIDQQLEMCRFLCKACVVFIPMVNDNISNTSKDNKILETSVAGMVAELDNLLTAFRLLALNPSHTRQSVADARHVLTLAIRALADALQRGCTAVGQNFEKHHRFMAENAVENCEPFVLQAEMGLMVKAMIVLSAVADASPLAAEIVVPKVLYWLNVLVTGTTLKSPENKREIVEECLDFIPDWVERTSIVFGSNLSLEHDKAIADIFCALDGTESFCHSALVTATKFESATRGGRLFFPTADEILLSSIYSLPKIGRKLLSDIFIEVDAVIVANESDLQRKDNSAVERLLRKNFFDGGIAAKRLFHLMPAQRARMLGAFIQSVVSAKHIAPAIFHIATVAATTLTKSNNQALESVTELYSALVAIFKGLAESGDGFSTFWCHFEAFVRERLSEFVRTVAPTTPLIGADSDCGVREPTMSKNLELFSWLLQDVGQCLTMKQHIAFLDMLIQRFREYVVAAADEQQVERLSMLNFIQATWLVFLQDQSSERVSQYVELIRRLQRTGTKSDLSYNCTTVRTILLRLLCSVVNREEKEKTSFQISSFLEMDVLPKNCLGCDDSGFGCVWHFRVRVGETRAQLLADSKRGIDGVNELFCAILQRCRQEAKQGQSRCQCDGENALLRGLSLMRRCCWFLSVELLDFWSRWADPDRCLLRKTLMWRQRIFCQFMPVYVKIFGEVSALIYKPEKGNGDVVADLSGFKDFYTSLLRMIDPILLLAKSIPTSMNHELRMLMPILTQALRLANTVDRQESSPEELRLDMSLFLDCTLELFRITESVAELCAPMDDDDSRDPPVTALSTFMNAFLSILGKECNGENMNILLKCLECLEVLTQKSAKERLKPYQELVVCTVMNHAKSRKRLVRQQAASVRNMWELLT